MQNIKVIIYLKDKPSDKGHVATAKIKINDIEVGGYKVVEGQNDHLVVYPPAYKSKSGSYRAIAGATDPILKQQIDQAIIEAYEKTKSKPKPAKKRQPPVSVKLTYISLKLIYNVYEKHKDLLTEFRLWFIARHALDPDGKGWVTLAHLAKESRTSLGYARRICKSSDYFRNTDTRVFYSSKRSLLKKHQLVHVKSKVRGEVPNRRFLNQIRTKKLLVAYITKCFMEQDFRKKPNYLTEGRIGLENAAERFNVSKNTIISNLRVAKVKKYDNVMHYKWIRFNNPGEISQWMMDNFDTTLQDRIRPSQNPRSFFILKDKTGYYLARRKPHIYKFTGALLVAEKRREGTLKH